VRTDFVIVSRYAQAHAHAMGRNESFSVGKVCAALQETSGNIARAARVLGCDASTVYRYKNRHKRVAKTLEESRGGRHPNGLHSNHLKTALETPLEDGYDEAGLRDYYAARAKDWCSELCLPEPLKVSTEPRIKDARIDLLIQHSSSATVVEVKSQGARQGDRGRLRYMLPGQLVWYGDLVEQTEVIPTREVNLVAAIDWQPSARFRRVLGQVDPHIHILQP